MASLIPAMLSVVLAALYVFGLDLPKDLETARNGALLVLSLWLLVVALRQRQTKPAAAQPTAAAPEPAPVVTAAQAAPVAPRDGRDVLSFLSQLQEKGRLLDFLMDDISRYGDAQVGAAARVVHQGAGAAVREYFDIKPVAADGEGAPLTLGSDYDAHSYRLIGRVVGEPPYRGHVLHRGWLTTSVKLPEWRPSNLQSPTQATIITPAEIELS